MKLIQDMETLESLYGEANPRSISKVATKVTPLYRQWIDASRFLILTTVGEEGTDASPRGDDGPVVSILDDKTILLPDWRGNNRLDSLRNIVRDGRASLMFMVAGCDNVVRANGMAALTADESITGQFEKKGKTPKTVIVFTIGELYFQCAKALMRSKLWNPEGEPVQVPKAGEFLREMEAGFDAESYDSGYGEYAKARMW